MGNGLLNYILPGHDCIPTLSHSYNDLVDIHLLCGVRQAYHIVHTSG